MLAVLSLLQYNPISIIHINKNENKMLTATMSKKKVYLVNGDRLGVPCDLDQQCGVPANHRAPAGQRGCVYTVRYVNTSPHSSIPKLQC